VGEVHASGLIEAPVHEFLERQSVGTLATVRPDGKARHTLVYYDVTGAVIRISTEAARGKARDVERTGWASLCVMGHEKPWPSCTLEGAARVVREGIGPATAALLGKITGNAPDPAPSDEQLAAAGRVILEIAVERVYGVSYVA